MSRTYSIACTDCKKHLWIAQVSNGGKSMGHVYGTKEHLSAMFYFLNAHEGHNLLYGNNCESPIDDFEEVEVDK